MSGYREHSFDPNSVATRPGPALRPFNWVQWTGVALIFVGAGTGLAYLAGQAGLIPQLFGKSPTPFSSLPLIGLLLVNSRRETVADPAPELAAARRKWLAITIAVCVCIFTAAIVFAFKGA